MARGLNDYGYEYPALADIIDETKASFKETYGENFNTESNSAADKMISLFCEREYQLWLLGGSIYSAQTIQGAEGIYLDDILGKRGIYRTGKTKATGQVQLYLDKTVPYTTTYPADTYSINSGQFVFQEDMSIANKISGQRILNSDLVLGNYTFTIVNQSTGALATLSTVLTNKAVGSTNLNNFLNSIKTFVVSNTIASNADKIFVDTTNGAIYIGFNADLEYVGLTNVVTFKTSPQVGTKIVTLDVIATTAGSLTLDALGATAISPTPSGFVKISNSTAFIAGEDSESDAQYKARALQAISSTGTATRPAVIAKLLSVEGVQRVKIFTNNTGNTDSRGIPPYHFTPVVYGGTTEAISQALYEVVALSNMTYGTTSYEISTEDGQKENIYHSKATTQEVAIRITYTPVNGKTLSADEQTTITNSLIELFGSLEINGTAYNIQLLAEAVSSISDGRFSEFKVEIKKLSDPDSNYSENDFIAGTTDILDLSENNVSFIQE